MRAHQTVTVHSPAGRQYVTPTPSVRAQVVQMQSSLATQEQLATSYQQLQVRTRAPIAHSPYRRQLERTPCTCLAGTASRQTESVNQ